MNVLFVSHTASLGGAEQCLLDLAAACRGRGAEALVVCPEEGDLTTALSKQGIASLRVPMMRPQRSPARMVELVARWGPTVRALRDLIRERRISVVHNNTVDALYGPFAAASAGVPCVWHIHESRPDPRWARRILAGLVRRYAARAVFNSKATLAAFAGAGTPPGWQVVYNGVVAHDSAAPARQPDGTTVAGFAGDMRPHKRPELFLRALAIARGQTPTLRGRVAGDGLLLEHCRRLAIDLGLEPYVTFLGRVSDVSSFFASVDLLVSTSEREGFGLVIAGAMEAGRPVIAPAAGGVPELVEDGISGYLVAGHEPGAYARRMAELAADPELGRRLGAAARERVHARFTLERYCDEMLGVLEAASSRR